MAALLRNISAGARLALGLRVDASSFAVSVGALVALIAFALVLDIALDALRAGGGVRFDYRPLQDEALNTGVLLLGAALASVALRQPQFALAMPLMVLAAEPLMRVVQALYRSEAGLMGRIGPTFSWAIWIALVAWVLFVIARAIRLAMSPRPRLASIAAIAGSALLFASGWGVQALFPHRDWWYAVETEDPDRWRVVSEEALVRQPQLLAEGLAAIEAQRPGIEDVYFVGFAPYSLQEVFRKDVAMANEVITARFDAKGRSIMLVNTPRTVLTTPLATVSNLRASLQAIGQRIDRDQDVVMVFLTSHGSRDHTLAVRFPPLVLDELTPPVLRTMLDEAGIRWRIVVVSACYSGGFIPALADEHTIVMTAAAADRTSFGCDDTSELTFFTDALFNQALRREWSLPRAFDEARMLVGERERNEGLEPPSDPQISVGAAMAARLPALEASLRERFGAR